jgi:hypothetical protein
MANHRVVEQWMGLPEETLEDLLRPGLRAVCVGINPSRVSVEAGHYVASLPGRERERIAAMLNFDMLRAV